MMNDRSNFASPTVAFPSLPPEIRNEIYRDLLLCPEPIWLKESDYHAAQRCTDVTIPFPDFTFHAAILRVNKLFSKESLSILYEENTFILHPLYSTYCNLFDRRFMTGANLATIRGIEIVGHLEKLLVTLKTAVARINDNCPGLQCLSIRSTDEMSLRDMEIFTFSKVKEVRGRLNWICGVHVSEEQYEEYRIFGTHAVKTSGETAPLWKHMLGVMLEDTVEKLPMLRILKLKGALDDTMGKMAMEKLKKRGSR